MVVHCLLHHRKDENNMSWRPPQQGGKKSKSKGKKEKDKDMDELKKEVDLVSQFSSLKHLLAKQIPQ